MNEATCTWSGQLPPRNYKNPIYSCKVFLGGVPWDITEGELPQPSCFSHCGSMSFRSVERGLKAGAAPLPQHRVLVYLLGSGPLGRPGEGVPQLPPFLSISLQLD